MTFDLETLRSKEVARPNPDIGFVLRNGEMNSSSRRLYSVLVYNSQIQGLDQKGKLPYALAPEVQESLPPDSPLDNFFWIAQKDLIDSADVTRNSTIVQAWLDDLRRVTVDRTHSVTAKDGNEQIKIWKQTMGIVEEVWTLNCSGGAGRAARIAIGVKFPPAIEPLLLNPREIGGPGYTLISLYYQSMLRRDSSLPLYEVCKRWATWGADMPKHHWRVWQDILVSNHCQQTEYRYFKRDYLKHAIAEINQKTDIDIELIDPTVNVGGKRMVAEIYFKVSVKKQDKLEIPLPGDDPAFDAQLIKDMADAGISQKAILALLAESGEGVCRENVALWKTQNDKGPGWLVAAIENDYACGQITKSAAQKAKAKIVAAEVLEARAAGERKATLAATESTTQDKAAAAKQRAIAAYLAQPAAEQAAVADAYCQSCIGGAVGAAAKGLNKALPGGDWNKSAMKLFATWLAAKDAVA